LHTELDVDLYCLFVLKPSFSQLLTPIPSSQSSTDENKVAKAEEVTINDDSSRKDVEMHVGELKAQIRAAQFKVKATQQKAAAKGDSVQKAKAKIEQLDKKVKEGEDSKSKWLRAEATGMKQAAVAKSNDAKGQTEVNAD